MEELSKDYCKSDIKFKGFIDLVIKPEKEEKIIVLDWKTTSWGWDPRRKSDPMNVYQLTLYKHFLAQKLDVDPSNFETYYALLKRTSKPGKKIEIFRVTSGKRKTQNALEWVKSCISCCEKEYYPKNKTQCTKGYGCEVCGTQFCSQGWCEE